MIILNFLPICLLLILCYNISVISLQKHTCPRYICDNTLKSNCIVHSSQLVKSEETEYLLTNYTINNCINDFYCKFNFTNPEKSGICINKTNYEAHKSNLISPAKNRPKYSLYI